MSETVFLNEAEEKLIVERIARIESHTTGEVRVHLASKVSRNGVLADAAVTFQKLGMNRTIQRNGVMLYIAVQARAFAIIGDEGIHKHLGSQGWAQISERLMADFKNGDFGAGILQALDQVGAVLKEKFPADQSLVNPNELTDEISKS